MPIPWSADKLCQSELQAGREAQKRLVLLLIAQEHNERVNKGSATATMTDDGNVDTCISHNSNTSTLPISSQALLKKMGYVYQLSNDVFTHTGHPSSTDVDNNQTSSSLSSSLPSLPPSPPSHKSLFSITDHALPPTLLSRLQYLFRPTSLFWRAHRYGPSQGYFSYLFPLPSLSASSSSSSSTSALTSSPQPRSALEQAIISLWRLVCEKWPSAKEATIAEWYVTSSIPSLDIDFT